MAASKIDKGSANGGIELPLVKVSKEDVYGALFVHMGENEKYQDALMKLQTWIMNYSEEVLQPLRDSGKFTEEFLEKVWKKTCVISPLTLTLYLHCLQMEQFIKLPDSEKERIFLEKIPDRFKPRYKGNISCRNAREVDVNEEGEEVDNHDDAELMDRKRHMKFVDFLREFGESVRKCTEKMKQ